MPPRGFAICHHLRSNTAKMIGGVMKKAVLLVLVFSAVSVFAKPLNYSLQSCHLKSSSPDKINIVFVPSGFNSDKVAFQKNVENTVKVFESFDPVSPAIVGLEYSMSFAGIEKKAFCKFNCSGIKRLLCCDVKTSKKMASSCGPYVDQVIVVHNSLQYGGAGYRSKNVATTSIHPKSALVAVHELGHSLFKLGDEYTSGKGTPSNSANCQDKTCTNWSDLLKDRMKAVSCGGSGCKGGAYYTAGETIMKSLTLPFLASNERISCCVYRKRLKNLPAYCSKFFKYGRGLDNFCDSVNKIIPPTMNARTLNINLQKIDGSWSVQQSFISDRFVPEDQALEKQIEKKKVFKVVIAGIEHNILVAETEGVEYHTGDSFENAQIQNLYSTAQIVLGEKLDFTGRFEVFDGGELIYRGSY